MMEAAIALIGVVLGALLSEMAGLWRERRMDRKVARNVRTLVKVEIEENLQYASRLFRDIGHEHVGMDDGSAPQSPVAGEKLAQMIRSLMGKPLPPWNSMMWQSQATNLATAFSEVEIAMCHAHYAHLRTIEECKLRMEAVPSGQRNYWVHVLEIWRTCELAFDALSSYGNPVDNPDVVKSPNA